MAIPTASRSSSDESWRSRFIKVFAATLVGAVVAYVLDKLLSGVDNALSHLGIGAFAIVIIIAALGGLVWLGTSRGLIGRFWIPVVPFLLAFAVLTGGLLGYRYFWGTTPTAQIEEPIGIAMCKEPAKSVCQFDVVGTSIGVYEQSDIALYILVFPTVPTGGGWYLQWPPVTVGENGRWKAVAYLGSDAYPASDADEFQTVALLATRDATYRGQTLDSLRSAITDLNLIDGYISWSPIVTLKVSKRSN